MEYTKVSNEEWEEIVLNSDNASFFHSPLWAKIMERTYGYRTATRLYEINGKKILIPMMELNLNKYGFKTYASMPGNKDQGGLFSESDITIDDFKSIVNDIVGGKTLSLYLALPLFKNLTLGKSSSSIKEEWKFKDEFDYVHLVNLEGKDFEDIWKNYKGKTRTHIRKAKKSGVEIRDATSLDDFKIFYDILLGASQKWGLETPPIPFKLLKNLYKYAPSHTQLKLAVKEDKIIAGQLSFPYSKIVHGYISSFLREYGTFHPTSLLYNEVIKQACQEGYKYFSFGPSGNLDHIRRVKEKFGAEKIEVNRYMIYSNFAKILDKINKIRSYSK